MIEYINRVNEIGFSTFLICIILAALIIIGAKELGGKVLVALGLRTNKSIEKEKLTEQLDNMQKEIDEFKTNRVHDREQSFDIQKQLTEKQESIESSLIDIKNIVNGLVVTIQDMQEKNDSKDRAKIKDRISQSYRFYHKEQKWTSMDKESFNDLIRSYEAAGGKNSFVHSTCEPESETWEVIDE